MEDINLEEIRKRAEEAKELADKATDGPWETWGTIVFSPSDRAAVCEMSTPHAYETVRHKHIELSDPDNEWEQAERTMRFISASRRLVPALVDDMKILLDEIERLKGLI